MARNQPMNPIFHLDGTQESLPSNEPLSESDSQVVELLKELLEEQRRQNKLINELKEEVNASQRQRANELGQWKQANPRLARRCRMAAETLSRVQNEFLERLTDEVADNEDAKNENDERRPTD